MLILFIANDKIFNNKKTKLMLTLPCYGLYRMFFKAQEE